MPVKSLMELAMSVIMKNIKELDDAGDFLPYQTLRPILLQIESGKQLRQIEINSPQVQGQTGEIWLKLIKKKFPMEYRAQLYKPPDPTKWYKVYEKYQKIHNESLKESEMKLKQALQGYKDDREKNTSKIVAAKMLPASHRAGYVGTKRLGPRDHRTSSLNFTSGSRTKTLSGAGVMKKVRREVKEIANIHGSLSRISQAPSRLNASSQIRKAPAAMINDYARAAKPALRVAPPKPPAETPAVVKEHDSRATYISDDECSDFEGDDDDLFDQRPSKSKGGFRVKARTAEPKPAPARPSASSAGPSRPQATARKGSGLLSNQGKKPVTVKTRIAPTESSRQTHDSVRNDPEPPRSKAAAGSPPKAAPAETLAPRNEAPKPSPLVRKRKPVDVFMRSKRR